MTERTLRVVARLFGAANNRLPTPFGLAAGRDPATQHAFEWV